MIDVVVVAVLALALAACALALLSRLAAAPGRDARLRRRAACLVLAVPAALLIAWQVSDSRSLQWPGTLVKRVEDAPGLIALSFDDGPSAQGGAAVLDLLEALEVRATFFFTGQELAGQPDLARRFVAAGHELGNHGWSHRRMLFRSPAWIASEIERTDALIRAAGQAGPVLFRPPYFRRLPGLSWYLHTRGRAVVLADVEPESWPGVGADTEAIVRHVLDRARSGSIVLLHVMYASRQASLRAVPGIVEGLRAQGYRLVTVSELLAAGGQALQR
ncbi:MAG: polysaccharide deacetylase family protein [Xanthomonadales bacterium]|nr:polysaccharide deacetylase family protein [Xanthomonadales bacterium]